MSHESNVLSYSECKIATIFWGFASEPHWITPFMPNFKWIITPYNKEVHTMYDHCEMPHLIMISI